MEKMICTSIHKIPIETLKSRLRNRPDSEHEQALIRIIIVSFLLSYFLFWMFNGEASLPSADHPPGSFHDFSLGARIAATYLAMSIAGFCLIVVRPAASPLRRLIMMAGDFSTISALLICGDRVAAPLYPIYLWVAFGNGFRYGLPYLAASVVVSVTGFSVVLYASPFWHEHPYVGAGLLMALILLPAYTATLIKKLTEAKAQAESANQAKSRFLASMSHELRTPLHAIIGMSDILRETRLTSQQQDMVNTVKTSGSALLGLIDEILDLSRIEASKVNVVREDFDLHRLLAEIVCILRPQARRKGLDLAGEVSPRLPWALRGDVRHLRQILTNLAANAVKFTSEGHVIIRACQAPTPSRYGIVVRFEVVDTGVGIAAESRERIFDSFTQADESVNRRFGGAGLGLAIARSLVELSGGRIGVDSEPDRGSTFWIEVPLVGSDAPTAEVAAGIDVLILGNDGADIAPITRSLEGLAAPLHVVSDVAAAVDRVASTEAAGKGWVVLIDDRDVDVPAGETARFIAAASIRPCAFVRIVGTDETTADDPMFTVVLRFPADVDAIAGAVRGAIALGLGEAVGQGLTAAQDGMARRRRPCRVLVAEDNPVNRKVTARILEHGGHRPHVVASGEEALDALEIGAYDVLIVDVNMPGISGIELARLLNVSRLGERRLPILALTADATPETRLACEQAGIDSYLTKPIEAHRLLDAVDAAVDDGVRGETRETAVVDNARVTRISSHPRFRGEAAGAVDWHTIQTLREFCSPEFLAETLREYLADTTVLLREITDAADQGDLRTFADGVHALRGTSGNVGAQGLWRTCDDLRAVTSGDLTVHGCEYVRRLRFEFMRLRQELARDQALLGDRLQR
jgi:two-component system sensor histidine kinase RpfC